MSKPMAIGLAAFLSIIGALASLIFLAICIQDNDPVDFAYIVVLAAMALLFFASAGCFLVEGKQNQVTAATVIAFNIALIIISYGFGKWIGDLELGIFLICAAIPGVIACTKTGKDWFNADVI